MKNNIEKGIKECKNTMILNISALILFFAFYFIILWSVLMVWEISLLISLCFSFLMIIILRFTSYFTYQSVEINIPNQLTKNAKLEYLEIKIIGDSDEKDHLICEVVYVSDKHIDDKMLLKIPKSEIFKKERFFWKQKFKSIK